MMKRKFYALLLAGAMALSLAACGTNAVSPSNNGADNSAGVSQAPATAPAADPTQAGTTAASGSQTIKLTLEGDGAPGRSPPPCWTPPPPRNLPPICPCPST